MFRELSIYLCVAFIAFALLQNVLFPVQVYNNMDSKKKLVENIGISASYSIYVNGRLVAHKENDPVSKHFLYAVLDNTILLGTGYEVLWKARDGSLHTKLDMGNEIYVPELMVVFGDGEGNASMNDYDVFHSVVELGGFSGKDICNIVVGDNYINVTYTFTYISATNFTLREVAVFVTKLLPWKFDYTDVNNEYIDLLIAHDTLENGVEVYEDDHIALQYTIMLRYNKNGGFTENFYYIVLREFLAPGMDEYPISCRERVNGDSAVIDSGWDQLGASTYSYNDKVADLAYFAFAGVLDAVDPEPWRTYTIYGNEYKWESQSVEFVEGDGNITMTIRFNVHSSEGGSGDSICVFVYTDTVVGYNYGASWIMLMYIPVGDISFSENQVLGVDVVIVFDLV